jgi:hypothetical protein
MLSPETLPLIVRIAFVIVSGLLVRYVFETAPEAIGTIFLIAFAGGYLSGMLDKEW